MGRNFTRQFKKVLAEYDFRDLTAIIILCSHFYENSEEEKDEYEEIKNLYAKVLAFYNFDSKNTQIDYSDNCTIENIRLSLFDYLTKKCKNDYSQLKSLAKQKKISSKQLLYELSSPKTFAKTFIETLPIKLRPFNDFLIDKYGIDSAFIQNACESILKRMLSPCSKDEIITHRITNISRCFPSTFLDDMISINDKFSELLDINTFSKNVCFPVVKCGEEYHLISPEVFIDNFYKCIHRLYYKNSNKEQKDSMGILKGALFNEACEQLFINFGFSNILSNYYYNDGEIDLLVIDKDVLFVVECKSRNYTDKVSSESNAYEKANNSNLDSASKQVHRFIDKLNASGEVTLNKKEDKVKICRGNYEFIIPVVINLENLAELNSDFERREKNAIYISFDDLWIIREIIDTRKWLIIDFFAQILENENEKALADDVIDMFPFYCQYKNMSILFSKKYNILIHNLGNDFFQEYFSYKTDLNPISYFGNDISRFKYTNEDSYKKIIEKYHQSYWKTEDDFINEKHHSILNDRFRTSIKKL